MNTGRKGEQVFAAIMNEVGYEVEDVSSNPEYFSKDIDFIITNKQGKTATIEVKYDNKISNTGNLYLETFNINSEQWKYDGWWLHCEADYLAYGDANGEFFYMFHLGDLRERVKKLNCRTAFCIGDSEGLLVPLEKVRDLYTIACFNSPFASK